MEVKQQRANEGGKNDEQRVLCLSPSEDKHRGIKEMSELEAKVMAGSGQWIREGTLNC